MFANLMNMLKEEIKTAALGLENEYASLLGVQNNKPGRDKL